MSSGDVPRLASHPSFDADARGTPLGDLLTSLPGSEVRGGMDVMVAGVTHRTDEVRPGWLFFCVPGARVDGHDLAGTAERAGASVVVVQRWLDVGCAQVLVPSVRKAMGPVSAAFFGHPATRMTMAGVTGTNGKTTVTYLLESVFAAAGLLTGVIGTTGVRIAGRPVPLERTTPEAPELQRILAAMVDAGVSAVAMEVSSHGLEQRRVDGVRLACAAFTNLSQDHLDHHGTMEAYFEAKAGLFTPAMAERAVVNADSPHGRILATRSLVPTTTFGTSEGADLRAERVTVDVAGLSFVAGGLEVRSPLRGRFNVSNCLAAMAVARAVGVGDDAVAEGLATVRGVPGRMEPVEAGQPFTVLVDYAHTPDGLANALGAARDLTAGRLVVVFGAGGDRDRDKRPRMGEVATGLADLAVVTSDNPRSEDPAAIVAEVVAGARRGGGAFAVEPDRRLAIRAGLAAASPGDVVVVAGRGHEGGQEVAGGVVVPFDDRTVAREELAALGFASDGAPR